MDFDKYTTGILTVALSNKLSHDDKCKVIKDILEFIYNNGRYDECSQQLKDNYSI